MNRVCTKCKIDKPLSEFYKRSLTAWRRDCKKCAGTRRSARHIKNKVRDNNNCQAYYRKNKAKCDADNTEWAKQNREKSRAIKRKHLFGFVFSPEQYQILFDSQNGKCAVCEKPLTKIAVDHCHKTNAIRGILCPQCNVGLGMFKDSPTICRKAAGYLEDAVNKNNTLKET